MPPAPERTGPLPLNAPLSQFAPYVTPAQLKKLTPATRKLTKRDLLMLAAGEFTPATKQLSVQDMHSLRTVFAPNGRGGYYCCCCCCYFCCCCTAASVTRPLAVASAVEAPRASTRLAPPV
jgi:hypothetical protein